MMLTIAYIENLPQALFNLAKSDPFISKQCGAFLEQTASISYTLPGKTEDSDTPWSVHIDIGWDEDPDEIIASAGKTQISTGLFNCDDGRNPWHETKEFILTGDLTTDGKAYLDIARQQIACAIEMVAKFYDEEIDESMDDDQDDGDDTETDD